MTPHLVFHRLSSLGFAGARRVLLLGLALLAAVVSTGGNPAACGPFLPEALFTYTTHPDFPLDKFAQGRLGIVQPTYARSYLTVAYRHMSGLTVKDDEAQALVAMWNGRLGRLAFGSGSRPGPDGTPVAPPSASAPVVSGVDSWRRARRAIGELPDVEYAVERAVPGVEYQWYANVRDDAFERAAETLAARLAEFGKGSPVVRSWVIAQDLVFSADKEVPAALTPLGADAPALARADRAYQLAAAHFYAGAFAQARERFLVIAKDDASPWHGSAPYLAARCLLRQATVGPTTPADAQRLLERAITELEAVAADESAPGGLRESSRGLRVWAEYWRGAAITDQQKPDAIDDAARRLLEAAPGPGIGPVLDRFTRLLDRRAAATPPAERDTAATVPPPSSPPAAATANSAADLLDWLSVFQHANEQIFEARYQPGASAADVRDATAVQALARWRQRKTIPWLVAILTHARPGTPGVDDALSAAATVGTSSPAYATLAYHRARLRIESADLAAARALLDDAIAAGGEGRMPSSALNDLRTLRLRTARTLEEFLADGAKPSLGARIAGSDYELGAADDEMSPAGGQPMAARRRIGERMFDDDAAAGLNRLPLATLVEAAVSPSLPPHLQYDLAVAAWTRALLLEDRVQGERVAPRLRALAPVLAADVDAYLSAPTPEDGRVAGTWAILRHPGLSPFVRPGLGREDPLEERDALHDNWWCGPARSQAEYVPDISSSAAKWPGGQRPAFLGADAAAAAGGELERLKPASATWLARSTVAWAQARPADRRLPEALHLAVQASRFGCTDPSTGQAARAAFTLLHARFSSSSWAKKTRYWYK